MRNCSGSAGVKVLRQTFFSFIAVVVLLAGQCACAQAAGARIFVDCSQAAPGDGSRAHPWNSLDALSAHIFQPGDVAALKRGTQCNGMLMLRGSGNQKAMARLTAYGEGPRPKIVAGSKATQAVLLKNAEYWQIDSLDIAGGNTYGLLVTGDQNQVLSYITLRNLVVHDVRGGELKNKDNGLVVFLRGAQHQRFDHVLIDNVVAAHTNQWAGIMMGAGKFYSDEDGYNRDVVIRNSVVHDVYGDGIILFRVRGGLIDSSTAWLTGQQASETTGTPNAIWSWSCTDCSVRNNEVFLSDSPGVDGGAYDIDWATTRNTVEDNYAHDTQGYCVAIFGAGYVTYDAVVRGNVCLRNGLSPRLAALQGAVYIHTWDGGKIDGLTFENNTIDWDPPVPAAAIVDDEETLLAGSPLVIRNNTIRTSSPDLMQSWSDKLQFSANRYEYFGSQPLYWNWNGKLWNSFQRLQAAGVEQGSELHTDSAQPTPMLPSQQPSPVLEPRQLAALPALDGSALPAASRPQYWLVTRLSLKLDEDGLIPAETMARLSVLRTLAREYSTSQLQIVVLVSAAHLDTALHNAIVDLDTPAIRFVRASQAKQEISTEIISRSGKLVARWPGSSQEWNAATIGYAVRQELGVPVYAQMDPRP